MRFKGRQPICVLATFVATLLATFEIESNAIRPTSRRRAKTTHMKLTARGGTDGANMALFWPETLPDGADAALEDDPLALVEQLKADGKLVWFPCDSDGGYTLAVFVRTPVPDELLAVCGEPERYPALTVRGDGYFGGLEYLFKDDRSLLDRFPHMAGPVRIPDGTYAATVYQTDVPESQYDEFLRGRAGTAAKGVWDAHGLVAAWAVAGVFASLITAATGPRQLWTTIVGVTAALIVTAVAISRTPAYRTVRRARDEFETEYPSYVVHLE